MTYYISDLHYGHENSIYMDNRPFASLEEMNERLIERWNSVVSCNDTVYILGDFIWKRDNSLWQEIVPKFNGRKNLIVGNHDIRKENFLIATRKLFDKIEALTEIHDLGRNVILCHYPIPFGRHDYNNNVYMLYGHLHDTYEEQFMQQFRKIIKEGTPPKDISAVPKGNFYNVGCMMPWMNYTPRTLDEIISGYENYERREK